MIDSNVLISALLAGGSLPAHLMVLWREGRFDLLTSAEQLDEVRRVTRYPKLRTRLTPALAGRLINEMRDLAVVLGDLPVVTASADPHDNYLLAMAACGRADFLVTGDKRDLLGLRLFEGTRIIGVRDFYRRAAALTRLVACRRAGISLFSRAAAPPTPRAIPMSQEAHRYSLFRRGGCRDGRGCWRGGGLMAILEAAVEGERGLTPGELLAEVRRLDVATPAEAVDMLRADRQRH